MVKENVLSFSLFDTGAGKGTSQLCKKKQHAEVAVAVCDSRIPSSLLPFDMVRGRPAGATEFKRRTLDTTTRSQVNCAKEVAVAVCDSRIPSSLFSVGAPASSKGLSEETQRIVDRAVARFMAVDSFRTKRFAMI